MLYHLFDYLDSQFNFPGAGVFQYISFRALAAAVVSLLISIIFGKKVIRFLQRQQIGEEIRQLGLQGENLKKGTPTMGGVIILGAILIPTLLFARLDNVYILLLITATIWVGLIGFADDYIKVFKKDKDGLRGRFKLLGQVGLGIIVGSAMYLSDDILVREFISEISHTAKLSDLEYTDIKSLSTAIPFFKHNQLNYHDIFPFFSEQISWLIYILIVTFIITAVSNGANLTDGLDGLAAGTSAIVATVLAVFAYISGNIIFADYLDVMYIPYSSEVVIFCMTLVGACVGFLWYNSYPAQVFMGDTGSLSLGAIIAVLAIILRKELLIPLLCGVFLVEVASVIIQVSYFKYTRKKFGEGKRIFLMSPLHHHYQKMGMHETKIVARFWIVSLLLAILTLVTLKLR